MHNLNFAQIGADVDSMFFSMVVFKLNYSSFAICYLPADGYYQEDTSLFLPLLILKIKLNCHKKKDINSMESL